MPEIWPSETVTKGIAELLQTIEELQKDVTFAEQTLLRPLQKDDGSAQEFEACRNVFLHLAYKLSKRFFYGDTPFFLQTATRGVLRDIDTATSNRFIFVHAVQEIIAWMKSRKETLELDTLRTYTQLQLSSFIQ